jgi:predicted small lipoprotein YifL
VKSPNALLPAIVVATALATLLAGCGQTGPLYMPTPPAKPAAQTPAPATPAKPVTPTPVPASTQ